jgi:ribosomal protein S18 acetylase RimI-like enzyme
MSVDLSPERLAARKRAAAAPRLADVGDRDTVARVLSEAFADDPVANYFLRQDEKRAAARFDFFALISEIGIAAGRVWLAENDGAPLAASIWAPPPGIVKTTWLQEARMIPRFVACAGLSRVARLMRLREVMDAHHPKAAHWYLFFLGVAKDAQGQGLGSALLQANLAHVDEDGACAYLENSNARNMGLYQRAGFEVRAELTPEPQGPLLWAMWRNTPANARVSA